METAKWIVKKKTPFYISFIILVLTFSCKSDNKTDLKKLEELDAQKTTELITQILKDEKDGELSSSCISEKPRAISHPTVPNFDEYVKMNLKITDTVHYKMQSKLYKKFKITAELVPNKNILTETQFIEFRNKTENEGFIFWDLINENCTFGYCSISKPIFNENFDLAYVQIGTICGGKCGSGEERIYELLNGKWIKKERIGGWISARKTVGNTVYSS
ncbi:hypothetical protein [Aequorivita viscosa]|uniref:Uncharacterized protein n=1 Tax=Aequorivita viscosa TaxID=797419 RepID=A0A1M6NJP9_9FLAO|nr:hypothetical protein [Aequorivita viscosa]SDX46468.1 hypothetical protein SAMN05216556_1332 [Aequorivita viscosa]SHJ95903.1 hypothetical protein SAMN04487908_1352 [Aequorivita viscosa]